MVFWEQAVGHPVQEPMPGEALPTGMVAELEVRPADGPETHNVVLTTLPRGSAEGAEIVMGSRRLPQDRTTYLGT